MDEVRSGTPAPETKGSTREFDAVIAIGVLIKGSTMHFEYISEAVTHGLMRVQLDTGTPVVFGVLTALTDEQALVRAGIGSDPQQKGHSELRRGAELPSGSGRWPAGRRPRQPCRTRYFRPR